MVFTKLALGLGVACTAGFAALHDTPPTRAMESQAAPSAVIQIPPPSMGRAASINVLHDIPWS